MTTGMDEDQFRAAGYAKLQELRFLKAAARLLLQPQSAGSGSQQSPSPHSTSSAASSSSLTSSSMSPLLRSFSNIEHVMPSPHSQRLSRSSSITQTDLRPAARPLGLGRSNSVGSHRPAACSYQSTELHTLLHSAAAGFPSTRGTTGPTSPRSCDSINEHHTWPHRSARRSEPNPIVADERVSLLLAEVESLLVERQQLSARCCVLQKNNDQLAELVGRLMHTVQDQEQHMHEQEQQLQELQQLLHQQHTQMEPAGCADAIAEGDEEVDEDQLTAVASLSLAPAVHRAPHEPTSVPVASAVDASRLLVLHDSCGSPVASPFQQHQQHKHRQPQLLQQPGSLPAFLQQQQQQRHQRVDEWLGRRQEAWQEWQERLPLQHMHSGSSGTLTVTPEQQ